MSTHPDRTPSAAITPQLVVVCGSRYRKAEVNVVAAALAAVAIYIASLPRDAVVVTGGAPGVDTWAHSAAQRRGLARKQELARWVEDGVYNPQAGFERNRRTLDLKPDLVHAVWDGVSGGTADMVAEARRRGIPVEVEVVA